MPLLGRPSVAPQPLDVLDQQRRGVVAVFAQLEVRPALAGAALVGEDDEPLQIVVAPHAGAAAAAGAAVERHDRGALLVARELVVRIP